MALIRDDRLVEDSFRLLGDDEAAPATGAIMVSLARWQTERETLIARGGPFNRGRQLK